MIHVFVSKLNRYTNLTFSILLKIIFFFNIYLSLNYFYYRKSYYISSVLFSYFICFVISSVSILLFCFPNKYHWLKKIKTSYKYSFIDIIDVFMYFIYYLYVIDHAINNFSCNHFGYYCRIMITLL